MEHTNLKSLLRRVVLLPLMAMAALTGVLWLETVDLNGSMQLVEQADQVLDRSGHLLNLLLDMDASVRGYLVTGDETFLQPYREGRQKFDFEFAALYGSVNDNLPQRKRLEEVRAAYDGWLRYAEHVIALRAVGRGYDTLDQSLQGKRRLNSIREHQSEFENVEESLRTVRVRTAHLRSTFITTSCIVVGLGLGLFFVLFTRRHVGLLGSRLLQSEQRWSATLGSIGDGVIATDSNARITFLNPVASEVTGWAPQEAQGQPNGDVFKIIDEQPRRLADDVVPRVLKEGHVVRVGHNAALITKDGREVPVEHSASPIVDSEGKITGVVLVFRDVTEKRHVQEAQAEAAALLDLAHDSIMVLDLNWIIRSWNRGAEEMYGYSKEQAIGKLSYDLLRTDFPTPLSEIKADLLREGHWEGELTLDDRDGKQIVLASRWALQRGRNDQLSRVMTISSDITERKRSELALRESESAFVTLANLVPQLVWMRTPDGMNFYFNQRWVEYTGLTQEQGRGTGWSIPYHPQDKLAARAAWDRATQSGEPYRIESRLRAVDGNYRWFLIRGEPLRNTEGSIIRWFGTCTDIEDLKQAEQQLRALTTRLQQVREEERTKVARDLHDQIGQILTAIKMDMTWLARRLPEGHTEVRSRLSATVEMINDGVRSVRKICTGLRPGVLDDLGLAAAIEWQANEFASRTGIECHISVTPADLRLDNDQASAIFRIFQESLTNVARHAQAGSVHASLYEQDENLCLVVEDDGQGFSESAVSGSLGLLGMKERAQACGGDLQVSSSPGNGTIVTVRVPLRQAIVEDKVHASLNSR